MVDNSSFVAVACTDANGEYSLTRSADGLPLDVLTVSSGGGIAGTDCGNPTNDNYDLLELTADLTASSIQVVNLGLSVALQPVDTAPVITGPTDPVEVSSPDLVWNEVTNATDYRILMYDASGKILDVVIDNSVCVASVCTYTVPNPLQSGVHNLYVRGQNALGAGPWSTVYTFSVGAYNAPPASAPTISSPPDPTDDSTPDIIWSKLSDAAEYRLLVYAGSSVIVDQYINQSTCGTTDCTYTITNALTSGIYAIYVRGQNPLGTGPWSAVYRFTVGVYNAPPVNPPTVTGPQSPAMSTTPNLVWNELPDASQYRMLMYDPSGKVLDQVVEKTVCVNGICTYTVPTPLAENDYSLYVRGQNPLGVGPWSTPYNFTLAVFTAVPASAPTITAPPASTSDTTPNIVWDAMSDAWDYRILIYAGGVKVFDQTVNRKTVCVNGTCTYTVSTPLASGPHILYVRGQNPLGAGAWSPIYNFSIGLYAAAPTSAPTIQAPPDPTSDLTPDIVWSDLTDAAQYRVILYSTSGKILDQVVNKADVCTTGTCTFTSPVTLQSGNHILYIQGRNPVGSGPWSPAYNFVATLFTSAPTSAPTITGPTNPTTDNTPDLTWNALSDASEYRAILYGPSGKVLDQTVADTVCNAGVCTLTVGTALADGNHILYVRGHNILGVGAWSAGYSFTVSTTGPLQQMPTLTPTDEIPVGSGDLSVESPTPLPTIQPTLEPTATLPPTVAPTATLEPTLPPPTATDEPVPPTSNPEVTQEPSAP